MPAPGLPGPYLVSAPVPAGPVTVPASLWPSWLELRGLTKNDPSPAPPHTPIPSYAYNKAGKQSGNRITTQIRSGHTLATHHSSNPHSSPVAVPTALPSRLTFCHLPSLNPFPSSSTSYWTGLSSFPVAVPST